MKRVLLLVLCLVFLAGSLFVGCNDNDPSNDKTTTGTGTGNATTEPIETEQLTDELPDKNMDGFTFRILHHSQDWLGWATNIMDAEGYTNEPINDAMYDRRIYLEERFGVEIETEPTWMVNADAIMPLVMAGECEYHLFMVYDLFATGLFPYFADMNDIPYLSLDESWWNPEASSIFDIGGTQYVAAGNFSLSVLSRAGGYSYNNDLVTKYNLTSPYEYVQKNEWTIENMLMMASTVADDINGDSQITNADQFGIEGSVKEQFLRSMFSAGISLVSQDEEGYPTFTLSSNQGDIDKLLNIMEMHSRDDGWYNTTNGDVNVIDATTHGTFMNGRSLFIVSNPHELSRMRDYAFDLRYVVCPKYSEDQDRYYAPSFGAEIAAIPVSYAKDRAEDIGIILEAMAFYTNKNIVPKYVDEICTYKYVREDESAEMIALSFDSLYFDFGINAWQDQVALPVLQNYVGLSGNFVNTFAALDTSVENYIKELVDTLNGTQEG